MIKIKTLVSIFGIVLVPLLAVAQSGGTFGRVIKLPPTNPDDWTKSISELPSVDKLTGNFIEHPA